MASSESQTRILLGFIGSRKLNMNMRSAGVRTVQEDFFMMLKDIGAARIITDCHGVS